MDFEFDQAKDALNLRKHGMPLMFAIKMFEGAVQIDVDERTDYGEVRYLAYGFIAERLCVCVFTDRDNTRRIISLRKANKREQNAYRQGFAKQS